MRALAITINRLLAFFNIAISRKSTLDYFKKTAAESDSRHAAIIAEHATYVSQFASMTAERDGYRSAYEEISTRLAYSERDATLHLNAYRQAPPRLRARQLCFMHIGKTAGTSLQHLLRETLEATPVYTGSPEDFDTIEAGKLDHYGLILGHFCYRHTAKFRKERYLVTFLRDPVNRVLSNYYFLRGWKGEIYKGNKEMLEAAQRLSLENFLKCDLPQVRSVTTNHQTLFLAADFRTPGDPNDVHLRENAIYNLRQFDFVGITEAYEESAALLFADLGLPLPSKLEVLNVTEDRISANQIPPETRRMIEKLNVLDCAIYAEARKIFEQQKMHPNNNLAI